MPAFKGRTVFEAARRVKSFLSANLHQREQTQELRRARERIKTQTRRIQRLRETLERERQAASNERARDYLRETTFGGLIEDGRFGELPEAVRDAALNLRDEIEIARLSEESAGRFEALKGREELKLHLGSGSDLRAGWVNVDLRDRDRAEAIPDATFINYDLRRGLPVEVGSCAYIYSSHFFEHLEYRHGVRLMRDCHRALRPGGVFRISLPDFRGLFTRYLQSGGQNRSAGRINLLKVLPDLEPGTETIVDHINYGVYQRGEHKYIYDQEKIMLLLQRIGYSSVTESEYREGVDPDSEVRRAYSFYVEALK